MIKDNFQIILLGIFAFFIVAGVIAFATFRGGNSTGQAEPVTIWGTLPQAEVDSLVQGLTSESAKGLQVTYREIREELFDDELVEALASGRGPDLIFIGEDLIERHQDKLYVIPFETLSLREFRDRFIEEGELYLRADGILALPFSVDPLVLFWNRTIFNDVGLPQPPQYWDEFVPITERITELDERGNVIQSAIAFGEYSNVTNAKEILTTLIMQAGNPITTGASGNVKVVLSDRFEFPVPPAEEALRFYTEFANPVKQVYSWNRSLPASRDAFLAGDVGMYVGYASEAYALQAQNPNLNFDVAFIPQSRIGSRLTYGKMHGLAILRTSPRIESAIAALASLTNETALGVWEEVSGLPPVRRSMLASKQTDAYKGVFYDSALVARGFLDPDPRQTDLIFRAMVEDVTSGRLSIPNSVSRADELLLNLFK